MKRLAEPEPGVGHLFLEAWHFDRFGVSTMEESRVIERAANALRSVVREMGAFCKKKVKRIKVE